MLLIFFYLFLFNYIIVKPIPIRKIRYHKKIKIRVIHYNAGCKPPQIPASAAPNPFELLNMSAYFRLGPFSPKSIPSFHPSSSNLLFSLSNNSFVSLSLFLFSLNTIKSIYSPFQHILSLLFSLYTFYLSNTYSYLYH